MQSSSWTDRGVHYWYLSDVQVQRQVLCKVQIHCKVVMGNYDAKGFQGIMRGEIVLPRHRLQWCFGNAGGHRLHNLHNAI